MPWLHWIPISLWALLAFTLFEYWMNPKAAWMQLQFKQSIAPKLPGWRIKWEGVVASSHENSNENKQRMEIKSKTQTEKPTTIQLFPFSLFTFSFHVHRVAIALDACFFGFLLFLRLLACSPFFTLWTAPDETTVATSATESRNASCYPNCSRRQTYHTLFPPDPPFHCDWEQQREVQRCRQLTASCVVCVLPHTTTLAHRCRGALAP